MSALQSVTVGTDRVETDGTWLIIHARKPFADWRVREFCKQPIYFQEEKYYLAARSEGEMGFAVRYQLAPWPAGLLEESPASFHYDAAAVASRDIEYAVEVRRSAVWYALLPLYPFLGLCWSGFKERVLWPVGFVPSSITSASIMLVFCLTYLDAIFFGFLGGGVMMMLLGAHAMGEWAVLADLLLIVVLGLDCSCRFSQLLRGDSDVPWGFLEWMLPRARRRRE